MLRWRLVSAAVIIAILVTFCWLDYNFNSSRPGLWLLPICVVMCALAATELHDLLSTHKDNESRWVAQIGVLLVVIPSILPILRHGYHATTSVCRLEWSVFGLVGAIILTFACEMRRYRQTQGVVARIATTMLVVIYVGLLGCFLCALRTFRGNEWGMLALLSMIIVVKSADIGAYAVGRLIGHHRLAPVLSPNKTVEGAIGGTLAGCLGAWLMFDVFGPRLVPHDLLSTPWVNWATYGVILSLAGLLGDLCESLIKRERNTKNSSGWLPGLGGILDLTDSIFLAAPAAYACWCFGLVGS